MLSIYCVFRMLLSTEMQNNIKHGFTLRCLCHSGLQKSQKFNQEVKVTMLLAS